MDTLFFASFEPLHEVPEVCSLCSSSSPVFRYDYRTVNERGEPSRTTGFCCAACASVLVRRLETAESRQWEEEESALENDAYDVSAFRKRRLATFPEHKAS